MYKYSTSNVTSGHQSPKCKHTFICRYVAPPGEFYYNTLLCWDQCNSSYGFSVTVIITVSNFLDFSVTVTITINLFNIFQLQIELIDFSVTTTVTDSVIKT